MPGNVWLRTWRTLPPKECSTDPDYSSQGQWPVPGYWQTYTDPQSGKQCNVWEGHYTYPGPSLTFVPTYAGDMFEGLMPNLVVPETTWGPHNFGPRRPALGAGPNQVRDAGPELSGLGHVAVQHGGRHRELQRVRRRGARLPHRRGSGPVHDLRHRAEPPVRVSYLGARGQG